MSQAVNVPNICFGKMTILRNSLLRIPDAAAPGRHMGIHVFDAGVRQHYWSRLTGSRPTGFDEHL